jgi:hypothetical protein
MMSIDSESLYGHQRENMLPSAKRGGIGIAPETAVKSRSAA